jgi:hypothetical protein
LPILGMCIQFILLPWLQTSRTDNVGQNFPLLTYTSIIRAGRFFFLPPQRKPPISGDYRRDTFPSNPIQFYCHQGYLQTLVTQTLEPLGPKGLPSLSSQVSGLVAK